jgi:short-subunit dehydrogenase
MRSQAKPKNSWAVITGASGGIGLEIARNLAVEGYDVVLIARGRSQLETLAAEIQAKSGVRTLVIGTNLAERDAADFVASELKRHSIEPEILINNAGLGLFGLHVDLKLEDEQTLIDLNITTLTRLTKLLLPAMVRRRSGRIMNVASTAAFQPGPYMAVYYATKAYVLYYSEAIAEELKDTGVSVTVLCPGPTISGFQDKADMHVSGLVKGKKLPTSKDVADYGVPAMFAGKRVAIHGTMNWIGAQAARFTPRDLMTKMVAIISGPK